MSRKKKNVSHGSIGPLGEHGALASAADPLLSRRASAAPDSIAPSRASLSTHIARPSVAAAPGRMTAVPNIDLSWSMTEHLAAVRGALGEFVEVLAKPIEEDAFDVEVITFSETASVIVPLTKATQAAVPELSIGTSTNFAAGLSCAEVELQKIHARPGVRQLRPVVVFMSDGAWNAGGEPWAAAERVRALADVVCIPFGPRANRDALTRIATRPDMVLDRADATTLRAFFKRIAASASIARSMRSSVADVGLLPSSRLR